MSEYPALPGYRGRLRPTQRSRGRLARAAGVGGAWIFNPEDVQKLVDTILEARGYLQVKGLGRRRPTTPHDYLGDDFSKKPRKKKVIRRSVPDMVARPGR